MNIKDITFATLKTDFTVCLSYLPTGLTRGA